MWLLPEMLPQAKRRKMLQLLPSILQSPASASHWPNPDKRQLTRSLENTACRSQPSAPHPHPHLLMIEEKRKGWIWGQSDEWHTPYNFTERGYLMWVLKQE